jgi:hypothetical protein
MTDHDSGGQSNTPHGRNEAMTYGLQHELAFEAWLKRQRSDARIGDLARRFAAGQVKLFDLPTEALRHDLATARAAFERSSSSKTSSASSPRRKSTDRSRSCPGCDKPGGTLRVRQVGKGREDSWHQRCWEEHRGRQPAETRRGAGLRTT